MPDIILRKNAIPLYSFLSLINNHLQGSALPPGTKILDCGAGGAVPPLSLFHQQGFEAWGIDISEEQIQLATRFCRDHSTPLHLFNADMRRLPFRENVFDYVYEHYSMCHLSKRDVALTINEMKRVLKKDGLCFLGVISTDTFPKSLFGEEKQPGHFWKMDTHNNPRLHTMFNDDEMAPLLAGWKVVSSEKQSRYLLDEAREISMDKWMALHHEVSGKYAENAWQKRYDQRNRLMRYSHLYYYLVPIHKWHLSPNLCVGRSI